MNTRALDLAVLLHGQLAALGPAARALSIRELLPWTFIRIGVATDDALRPLAVDLALEPARIEQQGRIWWRQVTSRRDGLVIVAAGPYHEGPPPGTAGEPYHYDVPWLSRRCR